MRARDDPATIAWPPFLSADSTVRHVLDGLALTERLPAEALLLGQSSQLTRLLRWAGRHSPFYQRAGWLGDIFRDLNRRPAAFWDIWRRIPILAKADLRAHGERINADTIPKNQLPIEVVHSSGSTGIVVEVRTTAITRTVWNALTVREHVWRRRDFSKRMGVIRYRPVGDRDACGRDVPSWGSPVEDLFRTGPASYIHIGHSVDVLAEWLGRVDPHYLLAHPSIAQSILERVGRSSSRQLCLEEIRLIAEPIDPELERYLVDCHHLRVAEVYSANEVGVIAFRCEGGGLHVQTESLLVEILDDAGRPCAPGETGHVVATALHNLATPLIRYDLGDYAIAGGACACGRSLPVIGQIRGRVRNLVRTPEGKRSWPVDLGRVRSVPAIRQAQFIQTSIDTIQLVFVSDRPLTVEEEQRATEAVRSALDYDFNVELVRVESIPRGPTGKFEEFMSRLADSRPVQSR
jgi:phenylacetate-CoA ligase